MGPAEKVRSTRLGFGERDDVARQFVAQAELVAAERPLLQDGKEQPDLVQPAVVGGRQMQVDPRLVLRQLGHLVGLVSGQACHVQQEGHVPQGGGEVPRTSGIGDLVSYSVPLYGEAGKQDHRVVALVLALAPYGEARRGWLDRVEAGPGLEGHLQDDRPVHSVQLKTAYLRRPVPRVRTVARHPALGLPRLEVQDVADAPAFGCRDGYRVGRHHVGEGLSFPERRYLRRSLSRCLDQQEHAVIAVQARAARAPLVGQPERLIVSATGPDFAGGRVDDIGNVTVGGIAFPRQHDLGPLDQAGLGRPDLVEDGNTSQSCCPTCNFAGGRQNVRVSRTIVLWAGSIRVTAVSTDRDGTLHQPARDHTAER